MQQTQQITGLEQTGLTAPLKNILSCVDALEANFEQRLAAIKAEHQQDIEEIMSCYADEKARFSNITLDLEYQIEFLQAQAIEAKRLYQTEHIEHKFTKDKLEELRTELAALTAALKSEQELIALAEKRIAAANVHLETIVESKPISRTRQFFMQIFEARPPKAKTELNNDNQNYGDEVKKSNDFSY